MRRILALLSAAAFLLAVSPSHLSHAQPVTAHGQPALHPVAHSIHEIVSAHAHATRLPHVSRTRIGAIDLREYAEPVQDQGQVGACAAFSTVGLRYWYLFHDTSEYPADVFAPEYQYAQISKGVDNGSTLDDNFTIQQNQGTEPLHHYSYGVKAGLYDYTDQPTDADHAAAAPYTISGWHYLYINQHAVGSPTTKHLIDAELQAGHPVEIGISVYDTFMYAGTSPQYPTTVAGTTSGNLYGYHAIVIYGRDANGNYDMENSWGMNWGNSGWVKLAPTFLDTNVFAAAVVDSASTPTPGPTATVRPTNTATAVPTSTPPSPTATATLAPPPPPPTVAATPKPGRWHCKGPKSSAWTVHLCRWVSG